MSLVLKSNRKSSKKISDSGGYRGANDWFVNADVANGVFLSQTAGVKTEREIGYMFSVARTLTARIYDENLNITQVAANTPRRTFNPHYKTSGLLIEEDRFNFFDQSTLVSKPTNELPQTTNTFAVYGVGGNATVSNTDVNVISGTGSYDNPMFFTLKEGGTLTPTVNVTAGSTSVIVEQLIQKQSTSIVPLASGTTKRGEVLTLSASATALFTGTKGAIVVNILENPKFVNVTKSTYVPYFNLILDANVQVSANRRFSQGVNTLTIRTTDNGTEVGVSQIATTRQQNKIAVSWDDGVLKWSVNGVSEDLPLPLPSTFKPNSVSLLSTISGWVAGSGNAMLRNMVLYNRSLTLNELSEATKSW